MANFLELIDACVPIWQYLPSDNSSPGFLEFCGKFQASPPDPTPTRWIEPPLPPDLSTEPGPGDPSAAPIVFRGGTIWAEASDGHAREVIK